MEKSFGKPHRQRSRRSLVLPLASLALGVAGGMAYVAWPRASNPLELLSAVPSGSTNLSGESWSTRRGRAPSVLGPQDSFRLGVWSIELKLAAGRADAVAVEELHRKIGYALDREAAPDLQAVLRSIAKLRGAERISQVDLLATMLGESPFLLEVRDFQRGQWARTAAEILATGKSELYASTLDPVTFPFLAENATEPWLTELVVSGDLERFGREIHGLIDRSGLPSIAASP